jgi:hypothetical protein
LVLKQWILWVQSPRVYAIGFLASLFAALLIVIAIALLGEYTKTRGRLLLSAFILAGFCLTSLGPSTLTVRKTATTFAAAGLIAAAAALGLLMVGLWATPNSDGYWKAAAIVTLLALTLGYSSWTLWRDSPYRSVRRTAGISAATSLLGTSLACLGIALEIKTPPYWWAFSLVAGWWVVSVLAVPVVALWRTRAERRGEAPGA